MSMVPFTHDDPALPATYPGFVFRVLRNEGHEAERLLAQTGLTAEHFADPNFRCGYAPLRRLLLNAIEETRDTHLGVRLAQQPPVSAELSSDFGRVTAASAAESGGEKRGRSGAGRDRRARVPSLDEHRSRRRVHLGCRENGTQP